MIIAREIRRVGPLAGLSIGAAGANAIAGIATARMLVPSDRGLVAVMITGAGVIAVTSALGTNVFLRARLPSSVLINVRGFYVISAVLLAGLAIPGLALGGFVGAAFIDPALGEPRSILVIVLFGASNFLWFQVSEALNATGRIREFGWINVLGSSALAAALLVAVFSPYGDVYLVMYIYAGSFLSRFGLALVLLRADVGEKAKGVLTYLRQGPRMLGYQLGEDLVYQLDKILLGVFSGTGQVGLYGVAAATAEPLRIPVYASSQYTLLDAARRDVSRADVHRRTLGWMAVIAVVIPLGWLAAPFLIEILYGPAYADATMPFRILLVAQLCLVPHLILSRTLVGLGGTWSASVTGVLGVGVLAILSALLMPRLGSQGAALAAVGAYSVLSVSSWFLLRARTNRSRGSV